jgi:hypothetical protein
VNGARSLAYDYIAVAIQNTPAGKDGVRVIMDVCCGDRWIQEKFKLYGEYVGLDLKYGCDLTKYDDINPAHPYLPDLIISCYGLQHLLNEEARVWTILRRIAKPTTKFVYIGRFAVEPGREMSRKDPLNAYNKSALEGLGIASGWRVSDFHRAKYEDSMYYWEESDGFHANAFVATLEPIL